MGVRLPRVGMRIASLCCLAVLLPLLAAAGCSLIDTSDLTGGGHDLDATTDVAPNPVAAPDASLPADASTDAASDAAASDAAAPPADATAGAGAVDASADPCLAPHDFCVDFDDGGLDASWMEIDETSGGTVALDMDASVSPPRSLVVTMPPTDASVGFPAALIQTLAGPASKAHAQVDLRLDAFDVGPGSQVNLFSIQLDPAPPGYQAFAWFVSLAAGQWHVQEFREDTGGTITKSVYAFTASFASFTRVALDIDLTQSPIGIELTLDGAVVIETTTMSNTFSSATGFDLIIGGIYTQSTSATWRAHFDNALLDLSN